MIIQNFEEAGRAVYDEYPNFSGFPKIPRLNRQVIITEKIDGTNAAVGVTPKGRVYAQSRKRIITPEQDNYGFAAWVGDNETELRELGPGVHFGEWWGKGIQRGYGLEERRFSLFNVDKEHPDCCHVVPLMYRYDTFNSEDVDFAIGDLLFSGSKAAPGYMNPEGVIVYHTAANQYFKVLIENDRGHKGS